MEFSSIEIEALISAVSHELADEHEYERKHPNSFSERKMKILVQCIDKLLKFKKEG